MIGKNLSIAAVAIACVFTSNVFAFDDNRQGFFMSVGAGLHGTSIEDEYFSGETNSETEAGIATSLKVGGGISNQFTLYYIRNASWFRAKADLSSSYTFVSGIGGIGGTYYLQESSPSAYIQAAVGFGDYAAPFADINPDSGTAFMFGAGYEFATRKTIEANLLSVAIDDRSFDTDETSLLSLQVTLNYMWY